MMHRLSTALLTTAIVLTVAAPEAKALHPAPFPHRHVEEAAPRPAEARPRREPVTPRYLPTIYAGIGISALGVLPKEGDPSYLGNGIDGGAGFELFVGWRINPWVAVDLEWFTTFHGTNFAAAGSSNATLSGLNGLVRLYLLDPSEFEPYAAIGLGLAFADESPGGSTSPARPSQRASEGISSSTTC